MFIWIPNRKSGGDKSMQEYLDVGKIVNTHGIKGELKVIPLTDNPDRFNDLEWVYIEKAGIFEKFDIEHVKFFKNSVLVKLKDVNDMSAAQSFKELFMKIDRDHAIKLPENTWFICDLLDCLVFETSGNLLGRLKEVLQTGSNDVYVVADENGKQLLIPALKSVVKEVLPEQQRIVVELPEGL